MSDKLVFDQVDKVFGDGDSSVKVLDKVSLKVKAGEFVAVVGPSGSGKSTFLSMAGALLSPTRGRILIDETDISQLSEKKLNRIRLEKIGFVFQSANVIPYLTVRDQLILISKLARNRHKKAEQRADDLLERLGLSHRSHHYPQSLSGGERQRVAIARAWMNDPEMILADEPTASLDSERGRAIVKMLAEEVKSRGKAAVMVTHDTRMLDICDRVVYIEDGKLSEA
ncbi:ABC transporter ATP-binding protein [Bacillus amyloliquefaciens]|uniref:ABC transporter ATP-binding protein n=1 Tax=Bacillus amyloliquefaciens TaxID=1390 RepID=UPI0005EEAE5C|nr:ABC transporter ATP-binding protein [Bacillus amyloliquefaciens]MDH3089067.1 ABC transporter ATP-binding protein [Bacillus amyloliquefaciens]MEC3841821.1 ABC transporter ATP-binding protein [Bacillus amyloliquefaciens]QOQ55587.1 ABC transporter ATP-binding protein [Bacillus amyloliquefaciens]